MDRQDLSFGNFVAADNLKTVEEGLSNLDKQLDYIQNQTRCNNIRIDGIQETSGETWYQTEKNALISLEIHWVSPTLMWRGPTELAPRLQENRER